MEVHFKNCVSAIVSNRIGIRKPINIVTSAEYIDQFSWWIVKTTKSYFFQTYFYQQVIWRSVLNYSTGGKHPEQLPDLCYSWSVVKSTWSQTKMSWITIHCDWKWLKENSGNCSRWFLMGGGCLLQRICGKRK